MNERKEEILYLLERLDRLLSRKFMIGLGLTGNSKKEKEIVKIREIPGLIIDQGGFKRILLRKIEPAERIEKRFRENLREIRGLKKEIVERFSSQEIVEELKSRNRLLVSELVMASEIEKIAPEVKRMLKLLVKEESLKGLLVKVREEFQREGGKDEL